MNKVLVLVPHIKLIGGVANYYSSLRPFFPGHIRYIYRGSRGYRSRVIRIFILISDVLKFIVVSFLFQPHLVVINSSIGADGLKRDAIFFKIARIFKKRVIVFFRGWESSFFLKKEIPNWFRTTFLRSDKIIVLSNEFKNQLIDAGYSGEIIIETTTVDERLLSRYTYPLKTSSSFSILFLSRIENDKGIYDALKAVKSLQMEGESISLDIAGEGSELHNVKRFIESEGIRDVCFHGFVRDIVKSRLFTNANVYLFPSFHGEGMPNSVLEAMAFGLPVLTTRVGGIVDFFIENKMGFYIEKHNPESIRVQIKKLLNSPSLCKRIGDYNEDYASNNFYSDKVAKRLIKHFEF